MLNQITDFFESIARGLGLLIKIPRPNQAEKVVCSAVNGIVGLILIGAGVVLKKSSLCVLGAFGIVGAMILSLDK